MNDQVANCILTYNDAQVLLPSGQYIPPPCTFSVTSFSRCYFFLGANGIGKSTLLNILSGTIVPDKGNIKTYGSYFESLTRVYQFGGLFKNSSIYNNLDLVCPSKEKIDNILAFFNLDKKRNVACRKLSGGQQKIVQLCRTILSMKKIWILDEPTAGVDSYMREKIADVLATHIESGGLIFCSTHDYNLIEMMRNKFMPSTITIELK